MSRRAPAIVPGESLLAFTPPWVREPVVQELDEAGLHVEAREVVRHLRPCARPSVLGRADRRREAPA